jgi:hypothetical protein
VKQKRKPARGAIASGLRLQALGGAHSAYISKYTESAILFDLPQHFPTRKIDGRLILSPVGVMCVARSAR